MYFRWSFQDFSLNVNVTWQCDGGYSLVQRRGCQAKVTYFHMLGRWPCLPLIQHHHRHIDDCGQHMRKRIRLAQQLRAFGHCPRHNAFHVCSRNDRQTHLSVVHLKHASVSLVEWIASYHGLIQSLRFETWPKVGGAIIAVPCHQGMPNACVHMQGSMSKASISFFRRQ